MHAKTTIAIFSLLLAGLTILNLMTPAKMFSENENRYLQQMPPLTSKSLLDGSFMEGFDQYVTDQFAFRDSWVAVKTLTERAIGWQSSGGVYFAQDGWLIEMFDSLNRKQFEANLEYLQSFSQKALQQYGIQVDVMLVPTASHTLRNKLPRHTPEISQHALLEQAAQFLPGLIDVSAALEEHSGEYIYYRTDHHWTSLGAFYAYNDWCRQKNEPQRNLSGFDQQILTEDFYGTTYSKASLYTVLPDTITAFIPVRDPVIQVDYGDAGTRDSIYESAYLEVKDKYSVFLNANQPLTTITSNTNNGRRLLLVKDSYANSFTQMLLEDYEQITLVDLRYFKRSVLEFIDEENFTDVLVLYNLKGFSTDTNLVFLDR